MYFFFISILEYEELEIKVNAKNWLYCCEVYV